MYYYVLDFGIRSLERLPLHDIDYLLSAPCILPLCLTCGLDQVPKRQDCLGCRFQANYQSFRSTWGPIICFWAVSVAKCWPEVFLYLFLYFVFFSIFACITTIYIDDHTYLHVGTFWSTESLQQVTAFMYTEVGRLRFCRILVDCQKIMYRESYFAHLLGARLHTFASSHTFVGWWPVARVRYVPHTW